jgi:hypothetical protein
LVDVLTKVLKEDCHQQATTVVSGTSHELAMLRGHLEPGPVRGAGYEEQTAELRAVADTLMQQFRSESDRLESEVTRYQDEIASLVAQLGQQVTSTRSGATLQRSQPQPDLSRSLVYDRPAVTHAVASAGRQTTASPSGGTSGEPESTAGLEATQTSPPERRLVREHRARWKGNALVGTITLVVVLLVLAIIGAF